MAPHRTFRTAHLVHSEHGFVVAGDAGFQVPLHVDLALVEHLFKRSAACE